MTRILALLGVILGVISIVFGTMKAKQDMKLRLALCGTWNTLHPGLQHSLAGDLVLSNQFDALVGTNQRGVIVPLAAKSWKISADFREFTFTVDTSLRYSDGSYLKAIDFKRSWEDALKLQPKSANSSLQDLLYKLEGYESFEHTGKLTGVSAPSDEVLVLNFQDPFRMALTQLAGVRYAAFKQEAGNFLGTGKYTIQEIDSKTLTLNPNPYSNDYTNLIPLELRYVEASKIHDAFSNDEIDGLAYGFADLLPSTVFGDPSLEVINGQDAGHQVVGVNANPGRIFETPQLRLAIQFLLYEILSESGDHYLDPLRARMDFQVYLPFQSGRLKDNEVAAIISRGKEFVPLLKKATENAPLRILTRYKNQWVSDQLRNRGISVAAASRDYDRAEVVKYVYKDSNYDLLFYGFSVANGDPDGIYHALGSNGAILNPVTYREEVAQLLETGREIIGQEALDKHYQEVSRAILKHVPIIHIGFNRSVSIIRHNRIVVEQISGRRNDGHLHVFRPRRL